MNIRLPERNQLKKRQAYIYILIIIVCIICVISVICMQFFKKDNIKSSINKREIEEIGKKTEEETETLKSEFNQIFINNIENDDGHNNSKKEDTNKQLVYTKYEKKENKTNSFDLEVHIPHINLKGDTVKQYNKEIENIFNKIAEMVLKSENNNIIYTVEYGATLKDDILSVIIKSNLKEGSKPQKVIIQTYNYDLNNDKEIKLEEVLKKENLDKQVVENKIHTEISIEQKKAEDLRSLGYDIYKRDINSDIYTLEKTTEFYLNENTLYIIYAYGNETATSEMDIVVL